MFCFISSTRFAMPTKWLTTRVIRSSTTSATTDAWRTMTLMRQSWQCWLPMVLERWTYTALVTPFVSTRAASCAMWCQTRRTQITLSSSSATEPTRVESTTGLFAIVGEKVSFFLSHWLFETKINSKHFFF